VDFRRATAAADADSLLLLPPFAPLAVNHNHYDFSRSYVGTDPNTTQPAVKAGGIVCGGFSPPIRGYVVR
jgi:hypothetical protein